MIDEEETAGADKEAVVQAAAKVAKKVDDEIETSEQPAAAIVEEVNEASEDAELPTSLKEKGA